MKNSKKCPKCQSIDLVRIPATSALGAGNYIPIGWSLVMVTRYICTSCGFSEEWVESTADLAKVNEEIR